MLNVLQTNFKQDKLRKGEAPLNLLIDKKELGDGSASSYVVFGWMIIVMMIVITILIAIS